MSRTFPISYVPLTLSMNFSQEITRLHKSSDWWNLIPPCLDHILSKEVLHILKRNNRISEKREDVKFSFRAFLVHM